MTMMQVPLLPALYGLDIETDTTDDGLDPRVASVIAAAVASAEGSEVFLGPELELLRRLDAHLAGLPQGIIVTWNGAGFDLPFLADRAALNQISLGLRLTPDPTIPRRRPPLPGHDGPYRATWGRHAHLDAYQLYKTLHHDSGVSCGLKNIARIEGLEPVEVDREHMHLLADEAMRAYVASDAALARSLAERRWGDSAAAAFVDGGAVFSGRRRAAERPR